MRHSFCNQVLAKLTAAGVLLVTLATPEAAAQVRGIRPPAVFQEAFRADYEQRDLLVFQEVLALDANQEAVITTLFSDYTAAYGEGSRAARERMNALRPQRPRTAGDIRSTQAKVRAEIEEMRRAAQEAAADAGDPETARQIMDDYELRLRERMTELQSEMHSLGFTSEGREDLEDLLRQMSVIAGEWSEAGDGLAAEFVANVHALLREDQLASWPVVDRRLRREKTIARGKLSGESVDLVAVFRGLEIEDSVAEAEAVAMAEAVAPVLESYELRLDEVLRSRNDYLESTSDDLFQATQLGVPERVTAIATQQIDLHRGVRDVNEEYIPAIAAELGEDLAARFREAANRTGFPRVYRPTPTARVLRSAARMTGLDEDQRNAILALESEYLVLLVDQNDRLRRVILREEPVFQKQQYERVGSRLERGEIQLLENPIRIAFDERRTFGDGFVERLRTMLPEDVFRRIPGAARGAVTRGRATPGG